MKERILQLRKEGLSYRDIAEKLGCSKSTVSYHCGDGQKEKTKRRRDARRNNLPGVKRIENFFSERPKTPQPVHRSETNVKRRAYTKLRHFERNGGNELPRENGSLYEQMKAKFGDNQVCYLTGQPVDLENSDTFSFDHIIPISKGGPNSFANMGLTTPMANQAKSNLLIAEFINLCVSVITNFGLQVSGNVTIPEHLTNECILFPSSNGLGHRTTNAEITVRPCAGIPTFNIHD